MMAAFRLAKASKQTTVIAPAVFLVMVKNMLVPLYVCWSQFKKSKLF